MLIITRLFYKETELIFQIFNSSLISGPETLVFPALVELKDLVKVILLKETRIAEEKQKHVLEYLNSLGLAYHVISIRSQFDRKSIQELAKLLENQQNLEIAHSHDVKASFYLLQASQKIKNRKFKMISTHHGVHARSGIRNILYEKFYTRFVLPNFDKTLVVCSSDKNILLQRGLSNEQVDIHLNGVTRKHISTENRLQMQKIIRKSWGVEPQNEQFIFGVVARLESEKRHHHLLKVIKHVTELAPQFNFQVLCFGRGSLQDSLIKKTEDLQLEKYISWMGYRSRLGEEFAGFDAIISLSQAEGLPINLIESGWAGTPVFATKVDGVPDLISKKEFGALVESDEKPKVIAQKLIEFASSLNALEAKGLAFQEHVERNFSQKMWLLKLIEIYKALNVNLWRDKK